LRAYAILEILVGLIASLAVVIRFEPKEPITVQNVVAIFGAVYIMIRGRDNYEKSKRISSSITENVERAAILQPEAPQRSTGASV
jgi:hypothetical protein